MSSHRKVLGEIIDKVFMEPSGRFERIVAAAGLDPKRDFRDAHLVGIPLQGADLRGFDFTGSDLRQTNVRFATSDGSTIFSRAILDIQDEHVRGLPQPANEHRCRFCRSILRCVLLDLGEQPFSNSYVEPGQESRERRYQLRVWVCTNCLLAQTDFDAPAEEIFSHDYAYFSSYSTSWVEHARRYAKQMTQRFVLDSKSLVVEVASNDGYLLQHFLAEGIPVLGVEPTRGTAEAAIAKGIKTRVDFFGERLGRELKAETGGADLTTANNVLAHVPDIADFTRGFAAILKPEGVATFEFPHVQRLIEGLQFDTIYHEHYSYLSLYAVERIFDDANLRVFDVEELPTHGGSLRVYATHRNAKWPTADNVARLRDQELAANLHTAVGYDGLAPRVGKVRNDFLAFLAKARTEGKKVAAYGAAAKGNTFLNYCAAGPNDITVVADANVAKQGKLLPGSHIPIVSPAELLARKPDYVVILPWNIKDEIAAQLAPIRAWGGKFVIAIPELSVF